MVGNVFVAYSWQWHSCILVAGACADRLWWAPKT